MAVMVVWAPWDTLLQIRQVEAMRDSAVALAARTGRCNMERGGVEARWRVVVVEVGVEYEWGTSGVARLR